MGVGRHKREYGQRETVGFFYGGSEWGLGSEVRVSWGDTVLRGKGVGWGMGWGGVDCL